MKKKLIVVAMATFCLVSCSKDENNNSSLSGTSWSNVSEYGDETVVSFTSETNFSINFDDGGVPVMGTYTYSPPTVTFTLPSGNKETGTISGNILTYGNDDYTKKGSSEVVVNKPTKVSASYNYLENEVTINWEYKKVDNYKIYKSESQNDDFILLEEISGTESSYKDDNIYLGYSYYYKVSAVKKGIESPKSDYVEIMPEKEYLQTPTGLIINDDEFSCSNKVIKLQWDEVIDAKEYEIYYRKGSYGDFTKFNTVSSTNSEVYYRTDFLGTTIFFKIKAINGEKESHFSEDEFITISGETPSKSPYLGGEVLFGETLLSWTKNAVEEENFSNYTVYYKASVWGDYEQEKPIFNFDKPNASFKKMGYWKVTVTNSCGNESPLSNEFITSNN